MVRPSSNLMCSKLWGYRMELGKGQRSGPFQINRDPLRRKHKEGLRKGLLNFLLSCCGILRHPEHFCRFYNREVYSVYENGPHHYPQGRW